MAERKGEKIGWLAGWAGGFLWVLILAIVFLAQGKWMAGVTGLVLVAVALAGINLLAPWRHPTTPYWKLLLLPTGLLWLTIAWAIGAFGGPGAAGAEWWTFLWLIPMLIPFGVIGRRNWADSDRNGSSK
jgi:hypothetical protein